jgi:hypothetical protein
MMEALRTSETSAKFYETTQRNIQEGCQLHTCRRKNLKSLLDHFYYKRNNTYLQLKIGFYFMHNSREK